MNATSFDSMDAAQEQANEVGKKRIDIPVRKSFVRSRDAETPAPLSEIYAGGRSGLVAVKLYTALIWRCARSPYETSKPARAWATLLDLPDPQKNGARRIKNAMRTLADANLITVSPRNGEANVVQLKLEDGSGHAYSLPSSAFQFARTDEQRQRHMYFKIARTLWLDGTFQDLPGPATIMLLILLAEQADKKDVWFSTNEFPTRYRISHKTRAEGTAQLVTRGLLETTSKPLSARWKSTTFDRVRTRLIYRLTDNTFTNGPDEVEPGTGLVDDGIPKYADVLKAATGAIAVAQPPSGKRSGERKRTTK